MTRSSVIAAPAPAGAVVKTDNRIFFRNQLYDVRASVKNVNTGARFEGAIKDISGSGMGLSTPEIVAPGTVLEISLEIPDNFGPLKLLGRAVWSQSLDFFGVRTGVTILNPRFMSVARILKLFF
ncbi:MAG: PilZ domain-containing protein [Deltaproteobacteria bacterium]